MNIDVHSDESHLLLNPRMPKEIYDQWSSFLLHVNHLKSHIWLTTSGTTQMKLVGLSKQALIASAKAVNQHLRCTSEDLWVNPLPYFHVGGLGIAIRSKLGQARSFSFVEKWTAQKFHAFVCDCKATLTSMVPTQVYDLVQQKLPSPDSLRAVLVGGGFLEHSLYLKARELGWPLLPSYGMTECSSTIAAANLESLFSANYPEMNVLSHVEVQIDSESRINLQSPALMSCYAFYENGELKIEYQKDSWFKTEDFGELDGKNLFVKGRIGDFIKIGGESVQFNRLEKIFEEIKLKMNITHDVVLAAIPDERLGQVVHLFSTFSEIHALKNAFDEQVLPYERIRKVHLVEKIPRSALGKVLKTRLAP